VSLHREMVAAAIDGHVARMKEKEIHVEFWWGNLLGNVHL